MINQTTQNNQESFIPTEAYLYFPKPEEIKSHGKRNIFGQSGTNDFDVQELDMIQKFREFAEKEQFSLNPNMWSDNLILRFLVAHDFKMDKTLQNVKEYIEWSSATYPIQLTETLQQFLNSGLLYMHGRDNRFRPIVIFNVHIIDRKKFDVNFVSTALIFWMDYILKNGMLPSQVEQWIFLCNIKGMGIKSLAISSLRKLFQTLQCSFKCRLYKAYILNSSIAIYTPWKIVQAFLDGDTKQKVEFSTHQTPEGLFQHANREQVEQQFGGTAPNCTQYWPPRSISPNYFVSPQDADSLITKEEYKARYQKQQLNHLKVNMSLIQDQSANLIKEQQSPSGQPVSLTEQPVSLSGQPVSLSGQPISQSEQPVSLNAQPMSLSAQPVSLSEQPVSLSEQPMSLSAQPVSLSEQRVKNIPERVMINNNLAFNTPISTGEIAQQKIPRRWENRLVLRRRCSSQQNLKVPKEEDFVEDMDENIPDPNEEAEKIRVFDTVFNP